MKTQAGNPVLMLKDAPENTFVTEFPRRIGRDLDGTALLGRVT